MNIKIKFHDFKGSVLTSPIFYEIIELDDKKKYLVSLYIFFDAKPRGSQKFGTNST